MLLQNALHSRPVALHPPAQLLQLRRKRCLLLRQVPLAHARRRALDLAGELRHAAHGLHVAEHQLPLFLRSQPLARLLNRVANLLADSLRLPRREVERLPAHRAVH